MAKKVIFDEGDEISITASHPTTPASGDPLRLGKLAGIAQKNELADGTVSARFRGVVEVNVDDDAATGIVPGATLYYHDTGTGTPATSVNNAVTAADAIFGTSLGTLGANATGAIRVRLSSTAALS